MDKGIFFSLAILVISFSCKSVKTQKDETVTFQNNSTAELDSFFINCTCTNLLSLKESIIKFWTFNPAKITTIYLTDGLMESNFRNLYQIENAKDAICMEEKLKLAMMLERNLKYDNNIINKIKLIFILLKNLDNTKTVPLFIKLAKHNYSYYDLLNDPKIDQSEYPYSIGTETILHVILPKIENVKDLGYTSDFDEEVYSHCEGIDATKFEKCRHSYYYPKIKSDWDNNRIILKKN